MYIDNVTKVSW